METSDLLNQSVHGGGLNICGLSPRVMLTTVMEDWPCYNCEKLGLVRRFSGSGWYEDDALCVYCGESSTGYRPFAPAWRKKNIQQAEAWLKVAVPQEEYHALTMAAIKAEMDWDD